MPRRKENRNSLQIMRDTVFALFIRELRTRFGGSRLGYFWAIVDPMAQAVIMAIMWSLIGRNAILGVPVALFLIVTLVPFKTALKIWSQSAAAINANKGVMGYRQVEPIDPVVTRLIIELFTFVIVYVFLLWVMAWFFRYNVAPVNWLGVLAALLLLFGFFASFGLALCALVEFWRDTPKIINMMSMPMMMISFVFYSAGMVPTQYWYLFSWNPMAHSLELIRENYFFGYSVGFGSWEFMLWLNLVSWFIALLLYRINRRRFKVA